MVYELLTDELVEEIAGAETPGDWLILIESEDFPGYWEVECLDPEFFWDFEDLLGRYRIVSPVRVQEFLKVAKEKHYHVVFGEDPERILDAYDSLKELPDVCLNSTLDNTRQGFLPWQIIGYNKLIRDDTYPVGIAVWDTGAGKTALEAAAIKHYLQEGAIDLAMVVVKSHNKVETQRKFKALADLDSIVIDGDFTIRRKRGGQTVLDPGPRAIAYEHLSTELTAGNPTIAITNYEKFRDDAGLYAPLFKGRRVFFCWDEMPSRLSSRTTQLYSATKQALYKSFVSKPWPKWMRHLVLSATPIENDPDGLFSWLNLVYPWYLGTVAEFQGEFVSRRNYINDRPEQWHNLDKVEARIDHITHRVNKDDPDVAKMFPEVIPDIKVIDWHPTHRAIYDRLTAKAEELIKDEESGVNALSLIQVFQMLCDAPSMVAMSATNRERFSAALGALGDLGGEDLDYSGPSGSQAALELVRTLGKTKLSNHHHTKIDTWREIILEKHPDEKIITHSTWAHYIFPVWQHYLDEWDVPYVTYTGTDKQRLTALDRFRDDPDIRVFLSGDAGADSIDIDVARVGVNYNGPWKWITEHQREGRRDRVTSKHKTIYTYTLMMADSVEDRKRLIRDTKYGYHAAIFEGRAVEGALSARLTIDDLRFMLFGDPDD